MNKYIFLSTINVNHYADYDNILERGPYRSSTVQNKSFFKLIMEKA